MSTREDRLHEAIDRYVREGRRNFEIRNRIKSRGLSQEEQGEAIEYLKLLREREGDRNIFSGEANLADFDRSPIDPVEPPVAASPSQVEVGRVRRPGPRQAVERREIEEAEARLRSEGKPWGERSVAQDLGVSRGAVRYALGKDRRSSTGP